MPATSRQTPMTPGQSLASETWLNRLTSATRKARRSLLVVAAFSLVINLLMLTGPLYMLQVYDRVLASGSVSTLLTISLLVVALYGFAGGLEIVRSRLLNRIGIGFGERLGQTVFRAGLRASLTEPGAQARASGQDLDTLRQFLAGPGPVALLDAPWIPIYLCVVYMLHPVLGMVATAGAAVLFALTLLNSRLSERPLADAAGAQQRAGQVADAACRNVEVIAALGMTDAVLARWNEWYDRHYDRQTLASDCTGLFAAVSKTLRMFLQSAMLGVGAWLALQQELSPGAMIAGSIIAARALAPVEQIIGQYRFFGLARLAYGRLTELLTTIPEEQPVLQLPKPRGALQVKNLATSPARGVSPTLRGIEFAIETGQAVGVIGPSASGKSSLARALVGVWPTLSGSARIDGATLDQWTDTDRNSNLGYLPQDVELFDGTVADNIRRLSDGADDEVIRAAEAAGLDAVIRNLPLGYQTPVGPHGASLSAGMRQRIGLARALYGNPALVILDEPNAHLDHEGEKALVEAVATGKARGQSFVIVAHRPSVIAAVDHVLVLERGGQRAFGPKEQIMNNVAWIHTGRKAA